jgi:hypothetical protein
MMTPYERVKAAWDSPDRDDELNRVVEAMAAEGVTRNELDTALGVMLDEVRAGGADETTEEIILGVCDRLHGWCPTSRYIKTRSTAPAETPPTDALS